MLAIGIVDVQEDFMNPKGSLYVPGAERIIPEIQDIIRFARGSKIPLFFTQDCHDGTEPEMSKNGGPFPLHCMKDTWGQGNIPEADMACAMCFRKQCYNVFDEKLGNQEIREWLKTFHITEVNLAGIVGNICVEAAALGLVKLGIKVYLYLDGIAWMDIDDDNNEAKSKERLLAAGVEFIVGHIEGII